MATAISGLSNSNGVHLGAKLQALGARFSAYRAHRKDRLRVMDELQLCDYRELRDMGISRYDFAAIANGTFKR